MKAALLTSASVALYLLHQDFWFWRSAYPLVFGFLPVGLFYHGVYAPPLASKAVAPNASLTVSYKLARPSTVTATMNGPGGAIVPVDSGARAPGVYRLNWSAAGQPQGSWTFRVVADDDQGRHSVAERDFTVHG